PHLQSHDASTREDSVIVERVGPIRARGTVTASSAPGVWGGTETGHVAPASHPAPFHRPHSLLHRHVHMGQAPLPSRTATPLPTLRCIPPYNPSRSVCRKCWSRCHRRPGRSPRSPLGAPPRGPSQPVPPPPGHRPQSPIAHKHSFTVRCAFGCSTEPARPCQRVPPRRRRPDPRRVSGADSPAKRPPAP